MTNYAAFFGANLRAARQREGLKYTDMAERTGFSLGRLSLIEHGGEAGTIGTMTTLAEAVGCPLSTLLELA